MRTHQSPLFRRVIAPWYDSEIACFIVAIVMLLVLAFGCLGVTVALDDPGYRGDAWVAFLLIFMSLLVLVSTAVRLFKRKRGRNLKLD